MTWREMSCSSQKGAVSAFSPTPAKGRGEGVIHAHLPWHQNLTDGANPLGPKGSQLGDPMPYNNPNPSKPC